VFDKLLYAVYLKKCLANCDSKRTTLCLAKCLEAIYRYHFEAKINRDKVRTSRVSRDK
jgi:hypothetical protein